jgi:hypothetical protein
MTYLYFYRYLSISLVTVQKNFEYTTFFIDVAYAPKQIDIEYASECKQSLKSLNSYTFYTNTEACESQQRILVIVI